MNIKLTNLHLRGPALAALLALFAPAVSTAVDVSHENILILSGEGGWVDGDKAAFLKRHQVNPDGFGGIERLFYTSTSDKGTLTIEGRALAGNNDFAVDIKFVNDDRGFIRAGFREFRTWFDGTGSFIPAAATRVGGRAFITLGNEIYAIDRTQAWIEGLFKATENLDLHFKYTRNGREGQKDSTSHADTNLTGGLGTRRIIPSFYNIDEKQDLIEFDATLRTEKTELVGAVRFDNRDINNSRNIRRRAFEAGVDRSITHKEINDSDLLNARAYVRHQYSDKVSLNAAYSHSKLDTVMGGSRIYGPTFDSAWNPTWANRQFRDEGFFNLRGDSETKIDVANINMVYVPNETFVFVPSFRVESETRHVITEFTETNFSSTRVAIIEELEVLANRKWDEWVLGLEGRYTGIKNWVFTGRATWSEGDGELDEDRVDHNNVSLINRDSLISKWTSKYALTANWYPTSKASFSFLYTFWNRYTDYDTLATSKNQTVASGDRYPAFIKSLEYTTDDFAVRMTLRPRSNVTLVSRYDYQTTNSVTNEIGLRLTDNAEFKSSIFSQSVSWSPASRLFVQGMVNYVEDTVITPAAKATGAATRVAMDQINDYWTTAITVGLAADERTDLYLQYNYFFADNFVDNSDVAVPYGLDRQDQSFAATWVRAINDRTKVSLRYTWAKNDEDSSLGLNDFEANLIYGKVEYRF